MSPPSAPDTGAAGSSSAQPESTEPGSRGRLTIAPRVIERIAQRAVSEVDNATGSPSHVLGIALGAPGGQARVSATVQHDAAEVSVAMSVVWPAQVRAVTDQVRARIAAQLADLAGLRHTHVAIQVSALTAAEPNQGRRVL